MITTLHIYHFSPVRGVIDLRIKKKNIILDFDLKRRTVKTVDTFLFFNKILQGYSWRIHGEFDGFINISVSKVIGSAHLIKKSL